MHRLIDSISRRSASDIASPGPALTALDKRAIRTAWSPALCHGLCTALALTTAVTAGVARGTAVMVAAGIGALVLLILLPYQARTSRNLSARRILRADLLAANRFLPYGEYRQWLASLPDPGWLWRTLGAPTPEQRLDCLQHVRTRFPARDALREASG
ncbi:MAG: hypothetical protein ACLPZR_19405 [Solirubrobacteraceae bacterium]